MGNLYDRIYYKAVPDFIDFHIGEFHWFIFNIADIFITVGIIFMITIEMVENQNSKIMKIKIFILLSLILLLSSCGTAKKAFSNQKNSSDEFLVEKAPLVMPPDYGELPVPENGEISEKQNINEIEKLIKNDKEENTNISSSSLEESLLDKIKKN